MDWLKENWLKIGLGIVAAFSLLYYFVILPQQKFEYQKYKDSQEQFKKEQEKIEAAAEEEANARLRTLCISIARSGYLDRVKLNAYSNDDFNTWTWDSVSAREYVEGKLKTEKDECYKKYPIN